MSSYPVITIDGPSGTGKGTVAHMLAQHLGWHILDSGILYRVLGYAVEKAGIDLSNKNAIVLIAENLGVRFLHKDNDVATILDGEDVSQKLRSEHYGSLASQVAAIEEVRGALLNRQRQFALEPPGLVTDGRDMGTVVFPDAFIKFFLDADVEERAKRRTKQLQGRGINVTLARVLDDLKARDHRDRTREFAPLKAADDAIVVDTTHLSVDEVYQKLLSSIEIKRAETCST